MSSRFDYEGELAVVIGEDGTKTDPNEIFADMEGQVYEGRGLSPDWDLQVFAPEDPVGSHARALDAIIGRIREVADAIWGEIAREEAAIRANPQSTRDPMLIGVFGGLSRI